ncbi:hypothetical protein LIER_14368 [Lithospermum erythrorhizon]|uniref:Uncharacterized protein n=1 Tax=Lithospermum erythrorhizon TaxID=34254 RepID=A0AAV3PYW3_LITER
MDTQVLKAAGFSPIADADLGALKGSEFCDNRPPMPKPVEVSFSSEEDEALGPLLRSGQHSTTVVLEPGDQDGVDSLEGKLKDLKKEKAREEGTLQCHLKNLVDEHITLQEKYAANVRRTEAHSSNALERTIRAVQARLEEAVKEFL